MGGDAIDSALVRRASAGDRSALRAVYEATAPRLVREVLAPILPDRAACEDALKETFVSVLRDPSPLARGELFPYLATIARNKALDRRRRLSTEGRFREALVAEAERAERALPDPEGELAAAQARKATRERIEAVFARMNERYATALRLRLLEERSREDCADRLALKRGTFDVLFFRACKQFRALYVETYGEEAGGAE